MLGYAARLKSLFSDLAKDEPKPLRTAFGRCIQSSAYNALKTAADMAERASRKTSIAQKVRNEHGIDPVLSAEALDVLEAALFGSTSPAPPPNPGWGALSPSLKEIVMKHCIRLR
ncbi:MAG: hypothetical protein LBD55_04235 [Treponema sp.]|nr:hypothetical protein [Treponema sp.]